MRKLDTHVDFAPAAMTGPAPNYVSGIPRSQVDLPTMANGGLDAVFFSVYTGQRQDFSDSSYARARAKDIANFDAVHGLAARLATDRIAIAYTVAEVTRLHAAGRLVARMGVENGYGLGLDIRNVADFHKRGARYYSLAHDGHHQLSDSNTGEATNSGKWHGRSPLGRQVVQEANRLGIMLDISHPSKVSNMQVMAMRQAPVIASHSGVRAIGDHSRNLEDEQRLALKENGGVVQLVAFNSYVKTPKPPTPERAAALDSRFPPPPRATVKDFVDHVDHAVKLIGLDHVGLSSDFDGGGIDGFSNATESFNVTLELVRRGYAEGDIATLRSGNLRRVLSRVEKVAAGSRRGPRRRAGLVGAGAPRTARYFPNALSISRRKFTTTIGGGGAFASPRGRKVMIPASIGSTSKPRPATIGATGAMRVTRGAIFMSSWAAYSVSPASFSK